MAISFRHGINRQPKTPLNQVADLPEMTPALRAKLKEHDLEWQVTMLMIRAYSIGRAAGLKAAAEITKE